MATQVVKDPNAVLEYGFNWTKWLAGDTIILSTWTVDGAVKDSQSNDGSRTKVKLSGGVAGTSIRLTNHITTATGLEDDRSRVIPCKER